jgi:hypothetical protein
MKATEALWAQEVCHHALSISPEMRDFFIFLRESGWYETVVDRAFNEVLEYLTTGNAPHEAHLADIKLALVELKPDQVGNAIFRFIINDTLEKIETDQAEPWHWATFNHFWIRWRERTRAKMRQAVGDLPEFIDE